MSLSLYNKKRHFTKTKEPEGKPKSSKGALKFVIQKHDASHVHYDFRLEMEGVLRSWAIPKGPSLDPQVKRLAMAVEDHPYNYRTFEGVIPAGEYGGGTVIVWDEGWYEPMNTEGLSKKEQEKLLIQQWHKGDLKIVLHGQKVNGAFALFKLKGRGENSWLLVKKVDDYANTEDITLQDESVKSGKRLVDVAHDSGTELNHPDEELPAKKSKASTKKGSTKTSNTSSSKKKEISTTINIEKSYPGATKAAMPRDVVPEMATLVDEPFDDDKWLFEIKWDGYRAVAYCDERNVQLYSRNLQSFTNKYSPVTNALKQLSFNAILDGEIVALNDQGMANFQALQNWQNTPCELVYYVFDIIWLDGCNFSDLSLVDRKEILKQLLPPDNSVIRFSDHIEGKGKDFYELAVKKGLEGIMGKRKDSVYRIGARTHDWVKIKVHQRQEVVIAGYTEPRNTREYFGSLLLGVYKNGEFIYVGHTGSGFNSKTLQEMYQKLQPLVIDKCPFVKKPKTNMKPTWVKPELVCEIKFAEWTKDNIARQPIFMGLRTDKKAKDVVMEKTTSTEIIQDEELKENKAATTKKQKPKKAPSKKKQESNKEENKKTNSVRDQESKRKKEDKQTETNKTETLPIKSGKAKASKELKQAATQPSLNNTTIHLLDLSAGKDQDISLDDQTLSLTNLDKIYWKKEGFTKGDMINYYLRIAPYMMPYMLNRPQSLNRHPNGIAAPNFYQKDVRGKVPNWIHKHEDYSESTREHIEYLVCDNVATLIYMANLGCIEMHPWHSRSQSWEYPDWCLIDLDPDKGNTYDQVVEVANVVKQVLDSIGAENYPKTSGSTGMHIYIPLGAKYTYEQSKQLAELVVNLVHQEFPYTSLERSPSKRKGKIYLDYLQNRQTQTAAAPYSLRPKPGVPVSTPLDWSEVKKGLQANTYTAYNIFDRLKEVGDLFRPVLGKGINLEKVLQKMQSLYK
jgi:bifunctional non-homologous end joining protein LigD